MEGIIFFFFHLLLMAIGLVAIGVTGAFVKNIALRVPLWILAVASAWFGGQIRDNGGIYGLYDDSGVLMIIISLLTIFPIIACIFIELVYAAKRLGPAVDDKPHIKTK